ncbi:MAG TPA: TonB family protein, partial [Dysgonamonadaceae bacterium]|nr:TonB family protein [Dysgonamonadaceae bacterium]
AVQLINNFNVSQLKQRIIMMNSKKSPLRKLAKYLSVLPLALLLITANSVYAQQNEKNSDKIYKAGKMLPEFPGGPESLTKFFNDNITYPKEAKEKGIKGQVVSSFIVRKDGSIARPQIVQSVAPSLDTETLRVINAMPKWIPYKEESDIVGIEYTLRFTFDINDNKDASWVKIIGVDILGKEEKDETFVIGFKANDKKEKNDVVARGYGSMRDATPQAFADKFGDGNPLIIVDDVKMEKGFDVNSIKPDDIESISVLKDASAKASYGNEGEDGVIVIVTKPSYRGKTTAPQISKDAPDEVFVVVENQPEYPGGMEALMKFLSENIRYPVEAMKSGKQGRVITSFIINKDGSISDIKIVRGVDPLLDAEAIRVIEMMPKWKPGTQRGQNVNVRFTMPVVFRLSKSESVDDEAMEKLKEKGPVAVYEEKDNKPDEGYLKFIAQTIKYPVIAQENGIMGVSRATYDVNAKGEISNIKITESVDPSLDAELVRVTKLMPKDIALSKTEGKAASNVEISALFRLQNGNTPPSERVESDVVVVGYGKPAE